MKCVRRTLANRMIPFDSEHSSDAGSATQKDSRYHVPCSCVALSLSWLCGTTRENLLVFTNRYRRHMAVFVLSLSTMSQERTTAGSARPTSPMKSCTDPRLSTTRRVQLVSMCRDNVIPATSANISLARARLVSEDQDKNAHYHLQREVNTKHYQCVPTHSAPP